MINKQGSSIYYFQLNSVLTRLTKSTAKWIMSFYQHKHQRGKRMYQSRSNSRDKYKYSFCDILYDVKYRTECIVLKETPCYVTLAMYRTSPFKNQAEADQSSFFQRRRWKSSELKTTRHTLATIQELSSYVYDLDLLFEGLTLETVK